MSRRVLPIGALCAVLACQAPLELPPLPLNLDDGQSAETVVVGVRSAESDPSCSGVHNLDVSYVLRGRGADASFPFVHVECQALDLSLFLYGRDIGLDPGQVEGRSDAPECRLTASSQVERKAMVPISDQSYALLARDGEPSAWAKTGPSTPPISVSELSDNPCRGNDADFQPQRWIQYPDECELSDCDNRPPFGLRLSAERVLLFQRQRPNLLFARRGDGEWQTSHAPIQSSTAAPIVAATSMGDDLLMFDSQARVSCAHVDGSACSAQAQALVGPLPTSSVPVAYAELALVRTRAGPGLVVSTSDRELFLKRDGSVLRLLAPAPCPRNAECATHDEYGCDQACRPALAVSGRQVIAVFPWQRGFYQLEDELLTDLSLPGSEAASSLLEHESLGLLVGGKFGNILQRTASGSFQVLATPGLGEVGEVTAMGPAGAGLVAAVTYPEVVAQFQPGFGSCKSLGFSVLRQATQAIPVRDGMLWLGARAAQDAQALLQRFAEEGTPIYGDPCGP